MRLWKSWLKLTVAAQLRVIIDNRNIPASSNPIEVFLEVQLSFGQYRLVSWGFSVLRGLFNLTLYGINVTLDMIVIPRVLGNLSTAF